jgi:septum formation protein
LEIAGIPFSVRARPVEEAPQGGENPVGYVRRLARAKAEAARLAGSEIVLGADTTVVVDDRILEKPLDFDDARRMLRLLAGRRHEVITGICLLKGEVTVMDHSLTRVWFTPITETEIAEYVQSGEPMDKAGAYAIQGLASKFVERVEGCYFNVIGLPLSQVYRYLKTLE